MTIMKNVITIKKGNSAKASIEGKPHIYCEGINEFEALGKLLILFEEEFEGSLSIKKGVVLIKK